MNEKEFDAPEYFSARAETYESDAFRNSPGLEYIDNLERNAVRHALGNVESTRVLDAGAGTGRFTRLLTSIGADVVSMDASPLMLHQCASQLPSSKLVVARVGDSLPFDSSQFDSVICIRVLKYVDDWELCLREFRRVLRPGGTLVIEVPNAISLARLGYGSMPIHFSSSSEVRSMLTKHGLQIFLEVGGTKLPNAIFRKASTAGRAERLTAIEELLNRLLGRFLARSLIFGARLGNGSEADDA